MQLVMASAAQHDVQCAHSTQAHWHLATAENVSHDQLLNRHLAGCEQSAAQERPPEPHFATQLASQRHSHSTMQCNA